MKGPASTHVVSAIRCFLCLKGLFSVDRGYCAEGQNDLNKAKGHNRLSLPTITHTTLCFHERTKYWSRYKAVKEDETVYMNVIQSRKVQFTHTSKEDG